MRLTERLEEVRSDTRLALRQLMSAPGFTLVAALTLALGIGVNSAIFSLVDAALMKPLPFGQMDRLVMLWERTPTSPKTGVAPLNMRDWNLQSQSFDGIAYNCSSSPSLSVSVASGLSRKAAAVASS